MYPNHIGSVPVDASQYHTFQSKIYPPTQIYKLSEESDLFHAASDQDLESMSPCHRYLLTYARVHDTQKSRMVFEPVVGDLGVFMKRKGLEKTLRLSRK